MTRKGAAAKRDIRDWQRMDAMLDEAGRQSLPGSDPPAVVVDETAPPHPDDEHLPRGAQTDKAEHIHVMRQDRPT
jgi:hypothetical protein